MRLFIAIDFEELKDILDNTKNKIDNSMGKINKVDTYHLTLKFLEDIPDDDVKIIKNKLSKIEFDKFPLRLDKIGTFPNKDYIKVIWAGVKPWDKVKELQSKIEESFVKFDFKKDFEFHPHITLARVKFVRDKDRFIKMLEDISIEEKEIVIKDFRLVKSRLTSNGPVYEDIACFNSL